MPAQPPIPPWARELGATPEGLAAFRARRRRGGMRRPFAPGAGPQPNPMPSGGPASGGPAAGVPPTPPTNPRFSDAMLQSGLDAGSISVKDAVSALDARKAGVTMPPPVKPPMPGPTKPGDGTITPPIFDPTGGKGTGAPTLPPVMQPPNDEGTVTPPIWVDPTGQKPDMTSAEAPQLPPVMQPPPDGGLPPAPPQRMAAFDFSPFEGQANYHQNEAFQSGWNNVFSELGGMDPKSRARAEEIMAGMGPIEGGGARGMNAWITAINRARGFEDEPAATPAGTNPPPPNPDTSADSGGIYAYGEGGSMAGGMANALMAPPPDAMAAALSEAGMIPGGRQPRGINPRGVPPMRPTTGPGLQGRPRPRTGPNPRPTLPNESGQARPRRGGRTLNGGRAVVADESGQAQVPQRRRAPNPRNPRAGGY